MVPELAGSDLGLDLIRGSSTGGLRLGQSQSEGHGGHVSPQVVVVQNTRVLCCLPQFPPRRPCVGTSAVSHK